jgi:hypothetical protein
MDVVNRPLDAVEGKRVAIDVARYIERHKSLMDEHRLVTRLDETIVGLCRPERFIRLVRRNMVFDGPPKKVARYPQVATVESLLKRTEERDASGRRKGGVVWHTQGSGKSLTMVMLAKAIAMEDSLARIMIVTDRTDLNDQIFKSLFTIFYALYDKVYRKDVLTYASACCKANGGAAGVDGQTFEDIEAYGAERWLDELTQELKNQTYQPLPVRRVYIPKPGGQQRPLGVPAIRDRVVMMAAVLVLDPIFEADLQPEQYAYRRGRSALDAVRACLRSSE